MRQLLFYLFLSPICFAQEKVGLNFRLFYERD